MVNMLYVIEIVYLSPVKTKLINSVHLPSMKRIFVFTLLLALVSCKEETPEVKKVPPFEFKNIPLTEKMQIAVSDDYLKQLSFDDAGIAFLQDYYKKRNYKPRWINDTVCPEEALKMKAILENNIVLGIPDGRAVKVKPENFIQDELYITAALARTVNDLKYGMIDFENKAPKPKSYYRADSLDVVTQFSDTSDIRLQFIKFGPNDSTYVALAKGLIEWSDTIKIDRTKFNVPSIKEDTIAALSETRKALISKGYLNDTVRDSLQVALALQHFQHDNTLDEDGVIGKNTCRALNESTYNKMERVALVMDKIRSKKPYPTKYLRINIPEYKLRFYEDDTLRATHNIVVGKPPNTTPELTSKLRKIVVYPYWNVPYSISTKEILPAVRRSVKYLAKHNYKVYRGDRLIDPYSVNWRKYSIRSFPFKIIQDPGPKNSLGIIKFDFHNEHSVYFHDTPAKSLFSLPVRAFSHGCMRTQDPVELGKLILLKDSISPRKFNPMRPDSLDSLLFNMPDTITFEDRHMEIKLIDPIPIFVEYETVVREGEKMIMHIDIYGRDEEYLEIMNR